MDEPIIDLTASADETDVDAEDLAMELWCSGREVCLGCFTIPAPGDAAVARGSGPATYPVPPRR